jgi:hypothetical protein
MRKVFVVSNNKCGTTTMRRYLQSLGWNVAPQDVAEALAWSWIGLSDGAQAESPAAWRRYIEAHDCFQDVPFSWAAWLPRLVACYPTDRFIYVRRDANDWYRSLVRHHFVRRYRREPVFGADGTALWTPELARAAEASPYQGVPLHRAVAFIFGTSLDDPYRKQVLVEYHERHMAQALRLLPNVDSFIMSLHELDRADTAARLADFLGLERIVRIPHENAGG